MLQNVNVKTRVRKKKRKIVVRLILLQLVLLAVASHYARAKFWGIVKYYSIELFCMLCMVYVLSYLKEKAIKKQDKKIVQDHKKEDYNDCKEAKEVVAQPIRTYNFNWVIKSENVKEVKDTLVNAKSEKIPYRSPFEATINTDKKVLYKSPFEPLHKRVVLVLDSAMDDFCYKLRYDNESRVFVRKKEKYKLRMCKNKTFVKKKEKCRYILRRYSNCKLVKKVFSKKKEKIDYKLCHFVPKNNYNGEYKEGKVCIINKKDKDDELLRKAIEVVLDYERATGPFLERKLNIGYLEALRLLDKMEEWGIVAKEEGSESRRILTTKEEWLELNM